MRQPQSHLGSMCNPNCTPPFQRMKFRRNPPDEPDTGGVGSLFQSDHPGAFEWSEEMCLVAKGRRESGARPRRTAGFPVHFAASTAALDFLCPLKQRWVLGHLCSCDES